MDVSVEFVFRSSTYKNIKKLKERQSSKFVSHPNEANKPSEVRHDEAAEPSSAKAQKVDDEGKERRVEDAPQNEDSDTFEDETKSLQSQKVDEPDTGSAAENLTDSTVGIVAANVSREDGVEVATSVSSEHMPSFDEWKKQRLEEHEKTGTLNWVDDFAEVSDEISVVYYIADTGPGRLRV